MIFLGAFALSMLSVLALTPALRSLATRLRFLDHPNRIKPGGTALSRTLFSESDEGLSQFVHAVRYSMNTQGDAREISETSFNGLLRLLGQY